MMAEQLAADRAAFTVSQVSPPPRLQRAESSFHPLDLKKRQNLVLASGLLPSTEDRLEIPSGIKSSFD